MVLTLKQLNLVSVIFVDQSQVSFPMDHNSIEIQPQRVEVFTIDEGPEPGNLWKKLAVIERIFIVILVFLLLLRL